MFKRIHVYDVDGVLLDSNHRHNYLSNGALDFADYFARSIPAELAKDIVLPLASQYRKDCQNPEIYTVICSVRSAEQKHVNSILEKIGKPNLMLLVGETNASNMTPGHLLKLRRLSRLFNLRQFANLPRYLWEDSKKNIDTVQHLFTRTFLLTANRVRQDAD